MNALLKSAASAGQKVHEELFGARLKILNVEIPCTVSGHEKDFMLEAGRSLRNFIPSLTFRLDAFPTAPDQTQIDKALHIEVQLPDAASFLQLKLGAGGLLADGNTFRFIAYDRNFAA